MLTRRLQALSRRTLSRVPADAAPRSSSWRRASCECYSWRIGYDVSIHWISSCNIAEAVIQGDPQNTRCAMRALQRSQSCMSKYHHRLQWVSPMVKIGIFLGTYTGRGQVSCELRQTLSSLPASLQSGGLMSITYEFDRAQVMPPALKLSRVSSQPASLTALFWQLQPHETGGNGCA